MRRSILIALLIVPNLVAACVIAYFLYRDFNQVVGIGTLAGVFYVAYSALAAPWIAGYLEDKRTHSTVLRDTFFAAFDSIDTGPPGVWASLNPSSQVIWGGDEFRTHIPMDLIGRRWTSEGGQRPRVGTVLDTAPAFASALSHMRAYPPIYSAWEAAWLARERYNARRPQVLATGARAARARLAAEYVGFEEGHYDHPPWPPGPFFVVGSVVTLAYVYVMGREVVKFLGPPRIAEYPLPTPPGTVRRGIGQTENSIAVVGESPEDRSVDRLAKVAEEVSCDTEFVAGVRELSSLEAQANKALDELGKRFEELSIRISLGHRIEGTCAETGY